MSPDGLKSPVKVRVLPSKVRFASAFMASVPVAVRILLFAPLVMKSDTSTLTAPAADKSMPVPADTATVPDAFGSVMVLSAVGSVIVSVVSYASAVAPSNTIALAASIVTVFTVVVVPATFKLGTSSVPVLGLYLKAPVSSSRPFDSL